MTGSGFRVGRTDQISFVINVNFDIRAKRAKEIR